MYRKDERETKERESEFAVNSFLLACSQFPALEVQCVEPSPRPGQLALHLETQRGHGERSPKTMSSSHLMLKRKLESGS